MKYDIKFTPAALEHLRGFKKLEQRIILSGIKQQLPNQPLAQTKNRKPLRRNPLSRWQLRVDKFRVFYDVDEETALVEIKAIGYKEHNQLFINGKEFEL